MPLKTLGPNGPRAVGERVKLRIFSINFLSKKDDQRPCLEDANIKQHPPLHGKL
jgi:hypothetical protein